MGIAVGRGRAELGTARADRQLDIRGDRPGWRIQPEPVGFYSYERRLAGGRDVRCELGLFPFWVDRQLEDRPEREQRQANFTLAEAALAVTERDLVALLLHLANARA